MKGANSKLVTMSYHGLSAVKKSFYPMDADRFNREIRFYYACEGLSFVPRLYLVDQERLEITIELVVGSSPYELDDTTIENFYSIVEILLSRRLHLRHRPAVEAVQSAFDLAILLKERAANLRTYKSIITHTREFKSLEKDVIRLAEYQAGLVMNERKWLGAWFSLVMLSPSDLGVHNCLRTGTGLKIFDFEYSGVDSVANLLFNFHLHPRHCDGKIDSRVNERISIGLERFCGIRPGLSEIDRVVSAYAALISIRLLHALSDQALNVRKERGLLSDSDLGPHLQTTMERLERYAKYANESASN